MKFFNKTAIAASLLLISSSALANNVFINTGNAAYGVAITATIPSVDADTTTGIFNEFGYSALLATSVYNVGANGGNLIGSTFYDTNIASELTALGIPVSGLALDGITTVSLATPTLGQLDIDALNPLVPPLPNTDGEGFLTQWDLQTAYHFDGILTAGGPIYTGGTVEIFVRDFGSNLQTSVLKATLKSSLLQAANLNLYFDITEAAEDYLNIFNPLTGLYEDANDALAAGGIPKLILDTNVNPPIPTANQLLNVGGGLVARQSTLDGSITATIPEPSTIALLGLGLLGLGLGAKRRKA